MDGDEVSTLVANSVQDGEEDGTPPASPRKLGPRRMPIEGAPQQLLIKHQNARRILDCSNSFYWALVRKGRITVAGTGRASRGYLPSILEYVDQQLAEARAGKAG
jgi:hypothetical protein